MLFGVSLWFGTAAVCQCSAEWMPSGKWSTLETDVEVSLRLWQGVVQMHRLSWCKMHLKKQTEIEGGRKMDGRERRRETFRDNKYYMSPSYRCTDVGNKVWWSAEGAAGRVEAMQRGMGGRRGERLVRGETVVWFFLGGDELLER